MQPSKTPQPTDSKLLLQHKQADGRNWRTALRIRAIHVDLATEWVRVALILDPTVSWRVSDGCGNPMEAER